MVPRADLSAAPRGPIPPAMGDLNERRLWWSIAAVAALGLALRVAAAQGGLWLDEAWSAVMARQAGTPLGVFLNINHDNNHHLNSLWLQAIGPNAPPMLQRALSIGAGTTTIVIAGIIGARRNPATGIVAALLFALSPILVTYGSEARGYALMLLALVAGVALVDRWLARPDTPPPAIPLALIALLGMLAQLTMAFGLAALGAWAAWHLRPRGRALLPLLARAFLPAAIATIVALALVFAPAWAQGGMAFGASAPFSLADWQTGLWQALHFSFGHGWIALATLTFAALLLGLPLGRLAGFGYAALLVVPGLVLIGRLPNAAVARLYLPACAGILLLVALMIGNGFARGQRRAALLALALILAPMLWADRLMLADHRADPARALSAIAARSPAGADVALDRARSEAILAAAAASARYPLALRQSCPAARYLFIERDGDEPFPTAPSHCGTAYREIAGDTVRGLSGTQWKLYRRSGN